jgi:hypothetical protein
MKAEDGRMVGNLWGCENHETTLIDPKAVEGSAPSRANAGRFIGAVQ